MPRLQDMRLDVHSTHGHHDSYRRRSQSARPATFAVLRASQGALGLLAAGRRHHHPEARQAGGGAGLSRGGPDRHQQPLRRARVLRQACRGRRPADRRLHAASRFRRPPDGQRSAAPRRQSAALAAGRCGRPSRLRRGRLAEPHEARLVRLLRSGRGRAPAHRDRAARGPRRRPDRADGRAGRPDRQGAARGPERGGLRTPEGAGEDLRRPALRRNPAPRPQARDRDRAGAARPRLCARRCPSSPPTRSISPRPTTTRRTMR